MTKVFVFNGDADGLCALQQLHLDEGVQDAQLVSGPKRRIALVGEVAAASGDEVTVLDVSLDVNRAAVERLLAAGARVRYFDHHHAGEIPSHPRFEAHIDLAPATCTSAIVDRHLQGRQRAWAAVGAFGDNLAGTGRQLAAPLDLEEHELVLLERLGILLNYNAYGERDEDLFFAPVDLHRSLAKHAQPLAFVRDDPAYRRLAEGYEDDMARLNEVSPASSSEHAALYLLPDAGWARRISGVLANQLAHSAPARAHAVLGPKTSGGLQVSVRAPLERPFGAAALCRAYSTGGGREAAAGINHLPEQDVAEFTERFMRHFARPGTP